MDKIRNGICSFLRIQSATPHTIYINERLDRESNAIKNKIWYRGDSYELSELYKQLDGDSTRFWAAVPSVGMRIRKIHTGLPALIVKCLTDIIISDANGVKLSAEYKEIWAKIEAENKFTNLLKSAVSNTLVIGDGAFKISFDTSISSYPIIEFIPGDMCDYIYERGRFRGVTFKTAYTHANNQYILLETYGYGFIESRLLRNDNEIPLNSIPQTACIAPRIEFDNSFCMAVPMQFFGSHKWENYGASIYDGKCDAFDALDEVWSQWMDALRHGRTKQYIPSDKLPRNPYTGELMLPNDFDNAYIQVDSDMRESANQQIQTIQPAIPYESYLSTYITALDMCLQGILSPSTLGIDTKKLDNAEAQREKEKTTLYTRNAIIAVLQEVIPELVNTVFKAWDTFNKRPISDIDVELPFGEYANPSFESQVETCGKARQFGLMSIETIVDELHGDTRTAEWKRDEVTRIKAEQGITDADEPSMLAELGMGNIIG